MTLGNKGPCCMATFYKKTKADGSHSYMARIRIKQGGEIVHNESKTFSREALAKKWAKKREQELEEQYVEAGAYLSKHTLAEVINRWIEYLEADDKLKRTKRFTLKSLLNYPIAHFDTAEIDSRKIIAHLKHRILHDKALPQTVNNDYVYIKGALYFANSMLDLAVNIKEIDKAGEMARQHSLVARSNKRQRRITEHELSMIIEQLGSKKTPIPLEDIVLFAIHSARRQAEITRIEWADLNEADSTCIVRDIKHPNLRGYNKTFKLTNEAMKIIKRQPKSGKYIFPYNPKTIGEYFRQACNILEIDDIKFHDLRHEATSRLFEAGYSIIEVQQFTCHESWNTLKRYTHLRPENVVLRD
jgi:integrase